MVSFVVQVSEVHKFYGTKEILKGVSLQVEAGEQVALMGPSGCGKSTLLHLIGGLDRMYEGDIWTCGKNLSLLSDQELSLLRNQEIGFVFQSFHLVEHVNCIENVMLANSFSVHPLRLEQAIERAKELLVQVGLQEFLAVRPTELSGGQKQRVAIARALFHQPKLLLCDEPTGNLDLITAQSIISLFKRLNQTGITLLWATHDPRMSQAANRIINLQEGQIVL